jgi:hypothetical protein
MEDAMTTDETKDVPMNEAPILTFTLEIRRDDKPAADDAPEAESGPVRG